MVPVCFTLMLFLIPALRWLPATLERIQDPYGQGQVAAYHLLLVWWCFLRGTVSFVITAAVVISDRIIRPLQVLCVSAAAVAGEYAAIYVTETMVGSDVGTPGQLVATAIGYSVVLCVSLYFVRQRGTDL